MIEEKRKVAANSVIAAVAITGLKAIVGITTGSLADAADRRSIAAEVPRVCSVITHITPAAAVGLEGERLHDDALEGDLRSSAMQVQGILDVHDFNIRRVGDQLDLSCHCLLADETPLAEGHRQSVLAEQQMRAREPRLGRVVIHPEPASEA